MMGNFIDLSGQRFGRLIVIDRAPDIRKGVARWNCICDCGEKCIVTTGNLKNGHTKSCGCYDREMTSQRSKNRLIDLVGKRFGRLVVLNREANKGIQPMWRCRCDCGNEVVVQGCNLRGGETRSCGCYVIDRNRETHFIDITGNRYNYLTVISRAGNIGKEPAWNCLCDCGNMTVVTGSNLKSENIISCGCANRSKGELRIAEYLKSHNITFEEQKRFVECADRDMLPFDFYLPDKNILCEFDGRHHMMPVDFAGRGVEWAQQEFERIKRHDLIKDNFCTSNGMKLIRIPYYEYSNISEILDNELKE